MWGWSKYVPVGDRVENAKQKMNKLRKKGKVIEPVEIKGRKIAKKFWGINWCDHLESFSDYDNRLPRGRTYARNGSICHLSIKKGEVVAMVAGSKLYEVSVSIKPLETSKWKRIKEKCSGQIGSLLELLQGKISKNVMQVVANKEDGLFPEQKEIQYSCNCPDWAEMCKHVAAVFYGIGNRLDDKPDLLFLLRGVDASELIVTNISSSAEDSESILDEDGLSEMFDIDLEDTVEPIKTAPTIQTIESSSTITGTLIKEIRTQMGLSATRFAEELYMTNATIYRWEKNPGPLYLQESSIDAINELIRDFEQT